ATAIATAARRGAAPRGLLKSNKRAGGARACLHRASTPTASSAIGCIATPPASHSLAIIIPAFYIRASAAIQFDDRRTRVRTVNRHSCIAPEDVAHPVAVEVAT